MKVSWPDLIGSSVMLTSNKTVCTKNRSKDVGSSLPTFSENPPSRQLSDGLPFQGASRGAFLESGKSSKK